MKQGDRLVWEVLMHYDWLKHIRRTETDSDGNRNAHDSNLLNVSHRVIA